MARIKYLEAAGLEVRRGRPAKGSKPSKKEILDLYVKEAKSIREVAGKLGCTKDMVYRSLKEFRIEIRSGHSRSKLRQYVFSDLEKGIEAKGLRGFAKELGVHENTVRHYIRGRKQGK